MLFHALLKLVKIQTRCLSWIESAPDLTCIPNILVPTNLSVGTYAPAPNPVSYGYILYFKQSARVSAVNRVATRTLREGKNNNNKRVLLSTKFKCLHLLTWNSETEKEIEREIKIWGAIRSTKIQTGPTGKRGPPQKVDQFFRNFSGWTEPIHWVLDRNLERSISSIKRVTGKFLEVSHRAWSSKTRVKKCTTKCAARASRLILWSSLLFVEYVNKQGWNFISLLTLDMVPWKSASRRFAYIWQSKWVGIIAIKTERREFKF